MTTGYRVDPAGVDHVLRGVLSDARPIGRAAAAVADDAEAAGSAASSALIGAALNEAMEVLGRRIQSAQTRVESVLAGTAQAGTAIVEGDAESASVIAREAAGVLSDVDAARAFRSRALR